MRGLGREDVRQEVPEINRSVDWSEHSAAGDRCLSSRQLSGKFGTGIPGVEPRKAMLTDFGMNP